jgi:hypothetical protein
VKLDDLKLGVVYAHSPGKSPNVEPILVLDAHLYAAIPVPEGGVRLRTSSGREKKSYRMTRGMLAMPAPPEVWELARAGEDIDHLPSIDALYSTKLIITDNLPLHGGDEQVFDRSEWAGVKLIWPSHIPGLFMDYVAEHDRKVQAREVAYANKAAQEKVDREYFESLAAQAAEFGVTISSYQSHLRPTAVMDLNDLALLLGLATGQSRR